MENTVKTMATQDQKTRILVVEDDPHIQLLLRHLLRPWFELELAVTESMKGSHWGPPTNFTILPDRSARPAYRVLLLFNPPASLNYLWLCAEEDAALPTSSGDDGVELFGAFCRDDYTLTAVKGRIAEAEDVHDPAFRELVGRVTGALFPADRDLYRARDTCIFQPNC